MRYTLWSPYTGRTLSSTAFERKPLHFANSGNGKRASYAVAWIDGAQVQMHKHLCPNWVQVNHQNGNGLDNRRENLRGVRRAASDFPGFSRVVR